MNMKPIAVVTLLLAISNGCVRGAVIRYRHSADYSAHIIYVSTNVAISKRIEVEAFDEAKTVFHIGKAHWAGNPDLVSFTGDIVDETIAENPVKVGFSADSTWLLVEEKQFDEAKGEYVKRYIAISLESGRVYSGTDWVTVQRQLTSGPRLADVKLEATALFFERLLITHLENRAARKQVD